MDWKGKIIEDFEGRGIYSCESANGGRLNIDYNGFSLCHESNIGEDKPKGVANFCSRDDFNPNLFYENLYAVLRDMQREDCPCRKCEKCVNSRFVLTKVRYITINTIAYCNSNCIYCGVRSKNQNDCWNPVPILQMLERAGMLDAMAWFDWGGGEPTQNPSFPETVKYLSSLGYRQRINTNAISFSQETFAALKKHIASIRISVDSGTPECFYRVKGHTGFDEVWGNITKYAAATDDIYLKYNVCNYNSDPNETDAFLNQCQHAAIKHILVDAEVNSYQKEKNYGPFYFGKREFIAAHYLFDDAKRRGFLPEVSTYAFTVRPNYDANRTLMLPNDYYDNLDYDVISSGIFIKVFATAEQLINQLFRDNKAIAVWGAGTWGKRVSALLAQNHIDFTLIDSNPDLQGKMIGSHDILSPHVFFAEHSPVSCVLATASPKSMLKYINGFGGSLTPYWCHGIAYRNALYENIIQG